MSTDCKSVYLPVDLLEALGDDTGNWWSDPALEPIICDAIRAWMAPAPPVQAPQISATTDSGYQWKEVFLPDGTKLRASFGRETWHAIVQDGLLKYGEHLVSPSCFANLHGSGNRNAWQAVWLRFPGVEQWVVAATCRALQKAANARLFGGDAPAAGQASRARQSQLQKTAESPSPYAAADHPAPRASCTSTNAAAAKPQRDGAQAAVGDADKGKNKNKNKRPRHRHSRAKKAASANAASAPSARRSTA